MCGIVGAVAQRNIVPVLIEGLRRLEYRGYDSCGVAVLEPDAPRRARSVARVADLDAQVHEAHLEGTTGVAHTRWATHGAPVTQNAHPIFSSNALALVHNGIIENFETLRDALRAKGYEFVSQTDTEVIAHLVHSLYRGDLFEAVREAVQQLHGAYAIAVTHKDQPHTVVGARQGSPLVVGHGDGENFLASDALALAGSTDRFTFLEEGDVCELSLDGVKIVDRHGALVERETRVVSAYGGAVELGPYRHFMQKEIFEQPRAISDTVPQTEAFEPTLFGAAASAAFANIDSLLILACGTSYYSGLTAKYWLESIAKIPTQVEIASEYRYRESVPNPR
ncbi:TPA: glutamine--fructose-6-phosphate transaminase (isomerizing), partial [Burkholderia vietnamiensis]|nr:glutamine--fructose-6-phosphate transaminase (isomerizing) [Burkholderia vietnamiensis]